MHCNKEHWLRECLSTVAIAQVPNFGTNSPIQFCLLHYLLHLNVSKTIGIVFIEHLENLHVIDFVFWFEEPNRFLLFFSQILLARMRSSLWLNRRWHKSRMLLYILWFRKVQIVKIRKTCSYLALFLLSGSC